MSLPPEFSENHPPATVPAARAYPDADWVDEWDQPPSDQSPKVKSEWTAGFGLLIVRLVFGLSMAAHGAQKLFGWFDGVGINGTAALFAQIGFTPERPLAWLTGVVEFAGGLAIAIGALTWLAAAGMAGIVGGVLAVGWDREQTYFLMKNGVEFEVLLLTVALTLTLTGAGRISLDGTRSWNHPALRVTGFVLGVCCAAAAFFYRDVM
ncbi:MAG: DoxX family protein [Actinomycetota bacterium]